MVLSPYSLLHVVDVCPSVLFVACAVKSQEAPQGLCSGVLHVDLAALVGVPPLLCLKFEPTVWLSTAIPHLFCLVLYTTKWSSVIGCRRSPQTRNLTRELAPWLVQRQTIAVVVVCV